ncbi:MAG TPA: 16S rRNA (cytidine(1402)-2'-O)-methyltransferase [Terriglobales bacterium]|nr:16S rRNA (cytidine(1402)-2'-O)-methyltransferase [Terriglobales bacterium]
MSGTLYIVATPIGNLEDLSPRAQRLLGEVAAIACEDTRHSRKLLEHFHIRTPLVSYYRENEAARAAELLARLAAGEDLALVTDAGAPLVSDPGARLVAQAVAAGMQVIPVPGASAVQAALMASGLGAADLEPWTFLGFLPARAGERRRALQAWAKAPTALVFFEAPHRLCAALADMEEAWGPARPLAVGRELTKLHEEFVRGTVATVRAHFDQHEPRGEFTLVAGPPPAEATAVPAADAAPAGRDQVKQWARLHGVTRSEAYRRWQQSRGTMNKSESGRG